MVNVVSTYPNYYSYQAKYLNTTDVSKAQAMAKECMSSGYKNCGW
jgi:hypothetical protein